VAQLALWYVTGGFQWETVEKMAIGWANSEERSLARRFVERLHETEGSFNSSPIPAPLYWELTTITGQHKAFAGEFRTLSQD
jgi:Mn-dependent DtxR family transcriptional regulator